MGYRVRLQPTGPHTFIPYDNLFILIGHCLRADGEKGLVQKYIGRWEERNDKWQLGQRPGEQGAE
jgi:hypothetical protein